MNEDLSLKTENIDSPEKILTYEQLSALPVVEVGQSEDPIGLGILYCDKYMGEDSFTYNYKLGDLTFIISIYTHADGSYEVIRKTKEYGLAFVPEGGINISSMNVKKIIKSINNYYEKKGDDHLKIKTLLFQHTIDAYTSEDIDAFRKFIQENEYKIPNFSFDTDPEYAWLENLYAVSNSKFIKLDESQRVELERLIGIVKNRKSVESRKRAKRKRRIGVRQNLKRVFKTELERNSDDVGVKVSLIASDDDTTYLEFIY